MSTERDIRPADCRHRLQDEGKAYPRSSCWACGRNIMSGLGTRCYLERSSEAPAPETHLDEIARLTAALAASEERERRMREALEPFGRWADRYSAQLYSDNELTRPMCMKVGVLRAARAALTPEGETK